MVSVLTEASNGRVMAAGVQSGVARVDPQTIRMRGLRLEVLALTESGTQVGVAGQDLPTLFLRPPTTTFTLTTPQGTVDARCSQRTPSGWSIGVP